MVATTASPSGAATPSGNTSQIITVGQNIATAINNAAKTYLQIMGSQSTEAISAATVVRTGAGRLCTVSITTAGTGAGVIYDASATGVTTNPIFYLPATPGVIFANIPVTYGIVVVPGTGQVLTVVWS